MTDDAQLLAQLRSGDEAAFAELVDRYHVPLVRLAGTFVPNRAVAEEVVQDTWLAVVRGIDRFEGRSSLKTWLFRILVNRARTTGTRERRQTPVDTSDDRAVPASRFNAGGQWATPPSPWPDDVEDRIVAAGQVARITAVMDGLPEAQRQVVLLRDFEGVSADEVCSMLGVSEANQRVLLHRGRSRIRSALEQEVV